MDAEVSRMLGESYARVRALLTEAAPSLHALAAALLERETLTGEEARQGGRKKWKGVGERRSRPPCTVASGLAPPVAAAQPPAGQPLFGTILGWKAVPEDA